MVPERRKDVETDTNEAAEEFDDSATDVTRRRDLSQDVKKRLKYKEDIRKLLEKRKPPNAE